MTLRAHQTGVFALQRKCCGLVIKIGHVVHPVMAVQAAGPKIALVLDNEDRVMLAVALDAGGDIRIKIAL